MQEMLAIILLIAVFGCVVFVFIYMLTLTAFFKELQQKEPDVWHEIGEPTLWNMLFMSAPNPRKYYAFFPKLKERIHHPHYKYAQKSYRLLQAGLVYVCLVVVLMVALAFTL